MTTPTAPTPNLTALRQPLCSMCQKPATITCGACRCSRYCSELCQEDDRPTHRLLCETFTNFQTPPTPDHYRAIFFPDIGDRPHFLWLEQILENNHEIRLCLYHSQFTSDEPPQGSETYSLEDNWKTHNPVLKRPHGDLKFVIFIPEGNETRPNMSFQHIDDKLVEYMRVPMVWYGKLTHLDTMSFRHIIDHIRTDAYTHYLSTTDERARVSNDPVEGVRINCKGDTIISGLPLYAPMLLSRKQFLGIRHAIPVSREINIILKHAALRPALPWRNRSYNGMSAVTFSLNPIFQRLNPDSWLQQPGTMVIARLDGKPLHPAHVEALVEYCISLAMEHDELFDIPEGIEGPERMKMRDEKHQENARQVLERASGKGFREFWGVWIQGDGREKWGDVVGPYDV